MAKFPTASLVWSAHLWASHAETNTSPETQERARAVAALYESYASAVQHVHDLMLSLAAP